MVALPIIEAQAECVNVHSEESRTFGASFQKYWSKRTTIHVLLNRKVAAEEGVGGGWGANQLTMGSRGGGRGCVRVT